MKTAWSRRVKFAIILGIVAFALAFVGIMEAFKCGNCVSQKSKSWTLIESIPGYTVIAEPEGIHNGLYVVAVEKDGITYPALTEYSLRQGQKVTVRRYAYKLYGGMEWRMAGPH